jgi:hypothetical protein
MTGRNPNVFYETGYAHALNKRTLLLTKNVSDIPFDLMHLSHIVYEDKIAKLKKVLEDRIRWCIENPARSIESADIQAEVYISGNPHPGPGESLRLEREVMVYSSEAFQFALDLDVHNVSSQTLGPENVAVAVVLPRVSGKWHWGKSEVSDESPFTTVARQSSKKTVWNLRLFHNVLPDAWHSWSLSFEVPHDTIENGSTNLEVRFYCELGSRTFPIAFDFSTSISQKRRAFEEDQKRKAELEEKRH